MRVKAGGRRVQGRSGESGIRRLVSGFDSRNKNLWKQDRLAVAEIEAQRVTAIEFDASRLHTLRISTSKVKDSLFLGLEGQLELGIGYTRSELLRCRFEDCRIKRLNFGFVYLEQCEFFNCDVHEVWAFDADLKECRFSGRIRDGAFNIAARPEQLSQPPRVFVANDFSECVIDTDIFRGGIELSLQRLNTEDGSFVIPKSREFLQALEKRLGHRRPSRKLRELVSHIDRSMSLFAQRETFVSGTWAKALGSDITLVRQAVEDTKDRKAPTR